MPQYTKTFRVFISSTFSDMRAERKILQAKVFPRLEEFCTQYGAKFQAIDLRWGVNEEIQLDQKTLDVCLNEIRRCQNISPKPNFIILLGDRYGWQPIPNKIPLDEFESILNALNKNEKDLLNLWYSKDENADPAEYVLLPRKGDEKDYAVWSETEKKLRNILRSAIKKTSFDNIQKIKYLTSATHREIILGALDASSARYDSREHVFAYFRSVKNLPQDITAGSYIDITDGKPDEYCKKQLSLLKEELRLKLPVHVNDYESEWDDDRVIFDEDRFALMVYSHIRSIIEEQLRDAKIQEESLQEESHHMEHKIALAANFAGRQDALNQISMYIASKSVNKIMVISGEPGTGKSSVIAKAVSGLKKSSAVIVYRFLGITPGSSTIQSLLNNICQRIACCYGTNIESLSGENSRKLPYSIENQKKLFISCLELATDERPLVLFLDGLDQLTGEAPLKTFNWLPGILPPNVKIIVSIVKEYESLLTDAVTYSLAPMSEPEGEEIIDNLLLAYKRKLTSLQKRQILEKFKENGTPLYLRFALEMAMTWHSYSQEIYLPSSIEGILNIFLENLEKEHTKELVSRAIGYILCGRFGGLSENDILGLLSYDDEYWNIFLSTCHPDHRNEIEEAGKLPVVLWSRLFLDLEPYLAERSALDTVIITLFHRQMSDFLRKRYLYNEAGLQKKIASYYIYKSDPENNYTWSSNNKYTLCVLPYHIYKSQDPQRLNKIMTDILYISKRCELSDVYGLVEDYSSLSDEKSKSVLPFREFIIKNAQKLSKYPSTLLSLIWHEGFIDAKDSIKILSDKGLIRNPWIWTKKLQPFLNEKSEPDSPAIEIVRRYDMSSHVSALSGDNRKAFHLKKIGYAGLVYTDKMMEHSEPIPIKKKRPLAMFCDWSGEYLAVAFEDGDAELVRLTYGGSGVLLESRSLCTFKYMLPEYEKPVMCFHHDNLIYQEGPEVLLALPVSGDIKASSKMMLKPCCSGELSSITPAAGYFVFTLRQYDGTVLIANNIKDSEHIMLPGKDAKCIASWKEDNVVIAYSDMSVEIYNLNNGIHMQYQLKLSEVPKVINGESPQIFMVTSKGNCFLWTSGVENEPGLIKSSSTLLPNNQYADFENLHMDSEKNYYILSSRFLLYVRAGLGSSKAAMDLKALYHHDAHKFTAVASKGPDTFSVSNMEGAKTTEIGQGYYYFAVDGKLNILASKMSGYTGVLVDSASCTAKEILNIPASLSAIAGSHYGGFWLSDKFGDIHYYDTSSKCTPAGKAGVMEPRGAHLYCWPGLLVWDGVSTVVSDLCTTLVFYRTDDNHHGCLQRIGNRYIRNEDGYVTSIDYDTKNDTLYILFQNGPEGMNILKQSSPEDFINKLEINREMTGIHENMLMSKLTVNSETNEKGLFMMSERGSLFWTDVGAGQQALKAEACLSPATPFNFIASGDVTQGIHIVDNESNIYYCLKEGKNHR